MLQLRQPFGLGVFLLFPLLLLTQISSVAAQCPVLEIAFTGFPYPIVLTSRITASSACTPKYNKRQLAFTPPSSTRDHYIPAFGRRGAENLPLYFKNEELSLHNGTEIPIALEDETGAGARRIVFVRKDEDWGVKYKGVPLVVIGVYGCEGSGDTAEYWTELIVASTQGLETVEWCVLRGVLHVKKRGEQGRCISTKLLVTEYAE